MSDVTYKFVLFLSFNLGIYKSESVNLLFLFPGHLVLLGSFYENIFAVHFFKYITLHWRFEHYKGRDYRDIYVIKQKAKLRILVHCDEEISLRVVLVRRK
jgi:hypothetical protein